MPTPRSCSACSRLLGPGLQTNLRELGHQGWRPLIVVALGEIFIALLTLGLVMAADAWFGLMFSV